LLDRGVKGIEVRVQDRGGSHIRDLFKSGKKAAPAMLVPFMFLHPNPWAPPGGATLRPLPCPPVAKRPHGRSPPAHHRPPSYSGPASCSGAGGGQDRLGCPHRRRGNCERTPPRQAGETAAMALLALSCKPSGSVR